MGNLGDVWEPTPNRVMRYHTASLLGAALAGQKKFAAVQRVIDLYDAWEGPEAWDRPGEAARWRKVLADLK